MEGYLWKQRYYHDNSKKGQPRLRYVKLDLDTENLFFKNKKETPEWHKTVPLDQVAKVEPYGENAFLLTMRYVATAEASGATFLFETETDTEAERDRWLESLRNKVDCAPSGLHLVVKNNESIHERYDCMFRGPKGILGTGMAGDVRLIFRKTDMKKFAMKTVSLSGVNAAKLGSLRREIDILKTLDHPHIAKLQETFIEPKLCCRLVMEVCEGGELFERLSHHRHFSERYACKLVTTMLKALNYLHNMNVVHRDLKLENWLFRKPETVNTTIISDDEEAADDEDADIALIDFGLSRKYRTEDEIMTRQVGTVYYVAPEVLKGRYAGNKCDMWSLGIITYMLICGRAPFESKHDDLIKEKILKEDVEMTGPSWEHITPEGKDFILSLLKKDPAERLSVNGALAHAWIKQDVQKRSTQKILLQFTDSVVQRLKSFSHYKEFKRLAMEVIAHSLDHSDIKDLTDMFEALDSDNDGYITVDELLKGLQGKVGEEEIRQIFNALDEENNGKIHVTEFVAGALQRKYHQEEVFLSEAFNKLDVGKKGKITVGDLRSLLGKCATEERVKGIWETCQLVAKSDKDEISFHEFLVFMRGDGEKDVAQFKQRRSSVESNAHKVIKPPSTPKSTKDRNLELDSKRSRNISTRSKVSHISRNGKSQRKQKMLGTMLTLLRGRSRNKSDSDVDKEDIPQSRDFDSIAAAEENL